MEVLIVLGVYAGLGAAIVIFAAWGLKRKS